MQVLGTIIALTEQLRPDEYDTYLLSGARQGQKMVNVLAAELLSLNIQLYVAFTELDV